MDLIHSPDFIAHVENLLERYHCPGLAIAIIRGDEIDSTGYGYSTLGHAPKKCTPDSLFDIASASKSMTHASVALLVEDEKHPDFKYETTMSHLLPDDFVMSTEEATKSVTVEDVLSHRTGLPRHDDSYLGINAKIPDSAKSVTRNLRNLPVIAPIRTKYRYCNQLFTVATHLVEHTSGLNFAAYLDTNFFGPLEMKSSCLMPSRARVKGLEDRIVTPYVWDKEPGQFRAIPLEESPESQGAGSIITSVNDYARYVRAVMNRQNPFTQEVYDGLLKSRSFTNPGYEHLRPHHSPEICTGGWEAHWFRGHMVVKHGGLVPGFSTLHFFVPSIQFGGCIFGNSEGGETVVDILLCELIEEALGIPKEQREDWTDIENEFLEASEKERAEEESVEAVQRELCPEGDQDSRPLTTPLEAYTGRYSHPGYHEMVVEIKNEKLFVDATDRTANFTLTFDHVCDQDKFLAHLVQTIEREDTPIKAGFKLEQGKVVSLGVHLEVNMGDELIWFDRVE